jgi:Tfp pilus assembly protein PilV
MLETMNCQSSHKRAVQRRGASGFTVVELMVAVSLMTLIVVALYAMFNQTQKALRSNEAQIDSTERGRGVTELVSRELESARVGMRQDATNLWLRTPLDIPQFKENDFQVGNIASAAPLRTNRFDDVYYLTKSGKAWTGVGYAVLMVTNTSGKDLLQRPLTGLGTLVRYETPLTNRDYAFPTTNLFAHFITNLPPASAPGNALPPKTNFSEVAQGIVHFRVLPYDTQGNLMDFLGTNVDSTYHMVRSGPLGNLKFPLSNILVANSDKNATNANVVLAQASQSDSQLTLASFRSNALPAYLELELGVLEPDALRIYNQMMKDDQPAQAKAYLEKRIAKVQIFRKRIPLRTVAQ